MDYKALFLSCFPSKQHWHDYLLWRDMKKKRREIQRRMDEQRAEIEAEMLTMTSDSQDDDFDPIAEDIWEQVRSN